MAILKIINNNKNIMVKQKKWVALLGYSGHGYYGMQRQTCKNKEIDALPTIESDLLKSFHKCGLINENEFNNPSVMRFQRAARTDKGVSAVKQIISLNLSTDMPSHLKAINENLPPQIKVFAAKRVTKYFDSKNFCDARTYSYLLPSFALCPIDKITESQFTATKELIEEFNSLLKMYTGTHNFHSFTAHKKPTDASAKRYIISFECSEPFRMGNKTQELEFLVARVKGQSFMLHQIRKMIGLAIAIMRGFADRSVITKAFGTERIDVPIAPGLGLLLEDVHYDRYNQRYGGDGIHESLLWDEVNDEIARFKNEHIYPHIVDTEIKENSMWNWLSTLPLHTFDVRDSAINEPIEIRKPLVKAYYNAIFNHSSTDQEEQKDEEKEKEFTASISTFEIDGPPTHEPPHDDDIPKSDESVLKKQKIDL